jgi:hypothetical protein
MVLIDVTRNSGIAFLVSTRERVLASGASSRSTRVVVSVRVSPPGLSVPVTSTF